MDEDRKAHRKYLSRHFFVKDERETFFFFYLRVSFTFRQSCPYFFTFLLMESIIEEAKLAAHNQNS